MLYGISQHTTIEGQLSDRAKALELAKSEMQLLEWLEKKPDSVKLLDVFYDYSFLLRKFTEDYKTIGILKDRNIELKYTISSLQSEIKQLKEKNEDLVNQLAESL